MISNRILPCVVLLLVLQSISSAMRVQKASEEQIKDSSVIVIGGVSERFDLVRPDKLTGSARTLPNCQVIAELPQPSEYLVGTLYKFRIYEVVRGNKTIRSGETITVLIPGPVNVSHRVVLSAQRKYLLQLSSLADAEKYKGTVVMDLLQQSPTQQPFDSHNVFTPVKHFYNAVPVTEDTKELIKRIRREAKR